MTHHDWHLAGQCEGISLHMRGRSVELKDTTGREPNEVFNFKDEERARCFMWRKREELYAKYDKQEAA